MEQFYKMWNKTQDIKTKIVDGLSKQLNVMQTIHFQQPNYILSLNERHTTHNTSVFLFLFWHPLKLSHFGHIVI